MQKDFSLKNCFLLSLAQMALYVGVKESSIAVYESIAWLLHLGRQLKLIFKFFRAIEATHDIHIHSEFMYDSPVNLGFCWEIA